VQWSSAPDLVDRRVESSSAKGDSVRAVVTGCAGFIGSHLSERLVADGFHVRGIDAFTPFHDVAEKEANLARLASEPRFALVHGDLTRMRLHPVLSDADVVVHLAAQPGVRSSFGAGFARCVHDNVLATQHVLEAALEVGCRRVVLASSSPVYGDAAVYPCPETAPLRPRSPYAVTKRVGEDLGEIARQRGLDVVALRYFTVYGPRQRPDMAMRRLCEAVTDGPVFELYGAGHRRRDFTHVDDAVDATVRAMVAVDSRTVLNVGGGQDASMAEVIEVLGELAGTPVPVRAGSAQPGDVRRTGADTTAARRLGWSPRVGLAEGLRSELSWVRGRRIRPLAVAGGAS
jgi:nucleoside-diphosphate-sugar epimerase